MLIYKLKLLSISRVFLRHGYAGDLLYKGVANFRQVPNPAGRQGGGRGSRAVVGHLRVLEDAGAGVAAAVQGVAADVERAGLKALTPGSK